MKETGFLSTAGVTILFIWLGLLFFPESAAAGDPGDTEFTTAFSGSATVGAPTIIASQVCEALDQSWWDDQRRSGAARIIRCPYDRVAPCGVEAVEDGPYVERSDARDIG